MLQELKDQYLVLYPEYKTLYGPYLRKSDNRQMVTIQKQDGKITSKQYAKVLLECKLNRRLSAKETVDHIDGDLTNDSLDNLQLLSLSKNISKSVPRLMLKLATCVWCNVEFTLTREQFGNGRNKAGPFCSRSCTGKYGSSVRNGTEAITRTEYARDYYTLDK